MASRPGPPARQFVLLAKEAPVALVLRRGPSAWCQLIGWDTEHDTFTPGAWFKGRLYEAKCDLSFDGALLVYSAFKGDRLASTYSQSWTAVSRPPWLHALALWPTHTTYGGGGRFVSARGLVLRGACEPHEDHPPHPALQLVDGAAPVHVSSGEVEGAEWSGRDQRGGLIHATAGRLYRRTDGRDVELVEYAALCTGVPDPVPAPEWATRLPAAGVRVKSAR